MITFFKRQTLLAQKIVTDHLNPGDSAIDGTAGNGADTLMLAQCVGDSGHVYAFDIQKKAVAETQKRLELAGVRQRVSLYCQGHETIDGIEQICLDHHIRAAMYNLGYLPGGDHSKTTEITTTKMAVEKTLQLLSDDAVMTICAYEHSAGKAEIQWLDDFCSYAIHSFDTYKIETKNHIGSPILYIIHKK